MQNQRNETSTTQEQTGIFNHSDNSAGSCITVPNFINLYR